MDIQFIDHSDEVIQELYDRSETALEACGQQATSHAKQIITEQGREDTGALRNGISHEVVMSEQAVYVGTNVAHGIFNEMGTGIFADGGGRQSPWSYQDERGNWHRTRGMRPIHFLKNAIANFVNEYKAIIEQHLRG